MLMNGGGCLSIDVAVTVMHSITANWKYQIYEFAACQRDVRMHHNLWDYNFSIGKPLSSLIESVPKISKFDKC